MTSEQIVNKALSYFKDNPEKDSWVHTFYVRDPADRSEIIAQSVKMRDVWNELQKHGCFMKVSAHGPHYTDLVVYRSRCVCTDSTGGAR